MSGDRYQPGPAWHACGLRRIGLLGAGLLLVAWPLLAAAAPRTPARDHEVLVRLSATRTYADARLRTLSATLARNPRDLAVAAELAELYLGLAARTGDARYYGYAKSALAPWFDRAQLPPGVLRSRAALRQYFHEFAQAKVDTERLLEREPEDSRAWFELALLELGEGDAVAALAACSALRRLDPTSWQLCAGYVESVGPNLSRGHERLAALLPRLPAGDAALLRWTLTALADAAVRLGRDEEAERHYRQAGQLDAGAGDVLSGYSDFLLDRHRPREALTLLAAAPDSVATLLRRCLAYRALGDPRATAAIAELAQRLRQRQLLNDPPYYAEEIRAQLYLFNRPAQALSLASEYWRLIKSPLSARLLMEAAIGAGDRPAQAPAQRWLHENPGVYPALVQLRTAGQPNGVRNARD